MIDENAFRKKRGIVRLVGTKFDGAGEIEEEWENHYTEGGAISSGVVRQKHGKVVRKTKL